MILGHFLTLFCEYQFIRFLILRPYSRYLILAIIKDILSRLYCPCYYEMRNGDLRLYLLKYHMKSMISSSNLQSVHQILCRCINKTMNFKSKYLKCNIHIEHFLQFHSSSKLSKADWGMSSQSRWNHSVHDEHSTVFLQEMNWSTS